MRHVIRFAALAALLLAALTARADPPPDYPFLSYDEGFRKARSENRRVFLYFGRYGCGWCDKTNKESFSDAALRTLYTNHYVLVYVDAESGNRITLPNGERITEMELGSRLNVFATPVFAWFEPDGTQIVKVPGYKTVEEFREVDGYVQGNHYRSMKLGEYLERRS